jgi:hypothetical protein
MFTGFIKCDCNGVCIEVNPFICTTSTSTSTSSTTTTSTSTSTTSTSSTTTTTTTAACNRWQYAYVSYTCTLCVPIEFNSLYNSNPLTLDNFYQYGDIIITPYAYLGCDTGESDASIPDTGFASCEEIICTTTTTSTTARPVICKIYGLQALTMDGGSWSAITCLGDPVGGLLILGVTNYTPCIDIDTLIMINGEIKEEINC